MIGSPDLLPFTGSEGFDEEQEQQEAQRSLPEELSVPVRPPAQPWSTRAHFHRDFVLVAEFSEQVGPKPVLTIPDDQKVVGSFDLNHFSVRIMSVDYQACGPGHGPPASPGPRLNFSEDSKVILGDSAEDAFAYVHHLTLYDLEARGMVRPFCLAYVCSDEAKLLENFSELSGFFSQASDSLKTGNRQAFSSELRRKLQELEFRWLTLLQETEVQRSKSESTEAELKPDELKAVELSVFSHRELLRQVTSYPNRKLKQPDFLPYDLADPLADLTGLQPPELCSSPSSCRSEHHLKPLEELCNSYFLSLMKEQLVDAERRLRGDRSVLQTARITRSLSRRLKLTNFLFELWSPADAEEEGEEANGAEAAPRGVLGSKKEVESEPQNVESVLSCVEETPIKLEAGEARPVTSDPCPAAEMSGSVSSGDSIEVLGTEKSYRTQQVVCGSDSREAPVGAADVCVWRPAVDPSVRRARVHARRSNSEDSIEVLSTTESIFPDDLVAITEEEAEHRPLANGSESEEETVTGCSSDEVLEEERAMSVAASDHEGAPLDREEPVKEMRVQERRNGGEEDATGEKTHQRLPAEAAVESRSGPRLCVNFAPPAVPTEAGRRSPPCPPLRLLSVDETSDCTSVTEPSNPPSPTRHPLTNKQLVRKRRRKAGLRALRFIKHHSFSQHAIFCLLSGRPLVVVGGDEGLVAKLVDALSVFLPAPGPDGGAVMPCLTTPLQLTDLLTWRLIGIHRSSSSTSSAVLHSLTPCSRYLALLDLDQRTLKCPPYSGSLINTLADPHICIRRGVTYLLHLESCLTALANRALLHTFLPARRPAAAAGATEEQLLHTRRSGSSDSDFRVLHFLSDLIKQHHAGRGPTFLGFSYSSSHLHRNTNPT